MQEINGGGLKVTANGIDLKGSLRYGTPPAASR
jgi:hypothetical protein